jgi:hypothetical protein
MEACPDGKPDGVYHSDSTGNGEVELRDPATGGYNPALDFIQFSRNLGSTPETVARDISTIFCLGCHDPDGSKDYVSGGSPTDPWNSGVTVVDVDSHFSTSNASWHPIKAAQDNTHCDTDTMNPPWDSSHIRMTCFDCHAAQDATGTQTGTVAAHGGSVTLRKAYDAVDGSATQLCAVCHKSSVYWNVTTHALGTDSAFNSTSDDGSFGSGGWHDFSSTTGFFYGCTVCHGTTSRSGGTLPGRTQRAENAHGFDTLADGSTAQWTSGARPWAFLRSSNNMGDWDNSPGTCTDMCGNWDYTYTPGGSY